MSSFQNISTHVQRQMNFHTFNIHCNRFFLFIKLLTLPCELIELSRTGHTYVKFDRESSYRPIVDITQNT